MKQCATSHIINYFTENAGLAALLAMGGVRSNNLGRPVGFSKFLGRPLIQISKILAFLGRPLIEISKILGRPWPTLAS